MEALSMDGRRYEAVLSDLRANPRTWLVTGVAGFIGSHLLEQLLKLDQRVVGLDNLSTGKKRNLVEVQMSVSVAQWERFTFIYGDIRSPGACRAACRGVDIVLHEAAIGSVPRSIENPYFSNDNNVTGTLNMLQAAVDEGARRFVYAASSAAYGDSQSQKKVEDEIGLPLSPYAVTKHVNELYAHVFNRIYGLETVGLRYFNVFGSRQDPEGPYAAVIPCWIASILRGEQVFINGTGETSRDFCYVDNVVQMNILAAVTENAEALGQVYNTAVGQTTSLLDLFGKIRKRVVPYAEGAEEAVPVHREFRKGDVLHSRADIDKAKRLLGYAPMHSLDSGLDDSLEWYVRNVC